MTIRIFRLKGIEKQLERIADALEVFMAHQGVHVRPHIVDTAGPEPEISYTDEEADAVREIKEILGQVSRQEAE